MKHIIKLITRRIVFAAFALLIQIIWGVVLMYQFQNYNTYFSIFFDILALLIVLRILNKWNNPSYKLAWAVPILAIPVFGITIYLLFGRSGLTKKKRRRLEAVHQIFKANLHQNKKTIQEISNMDMGIKRQVDYIYNLSDFPIYKNTAQRYFPTGEAMFESLIEDLKNAKHFIFLEYFIIVEGKMWNTILDILEEKASEGLDIRLIYDDFGCNQLPARYYKSLQAKGLKCAAFNPVRPVLSVVQNNRDHRKILVIDGKVGYTGGVNLADEYINEIVRFGYWKDVGIRIEGDAVANFTVMFLEMWHYITGINEDYMQFDTQKYLNGQIAAEGFVQPYADSPFDRETVGENVYMNIINKAKNYVYICTPYLIIDNEVMTALTLAAKSGVDVRIITPGIPDKKMVFLMTQSYYEQLISAGVRIFQYKKGFVHAKSFVCDDEIATVGSINLDYRSLYMHFECGVYIYHSSVVSDIKNDFLTTLQDCENITLDFCRKRNWILKTFQAVLRLIAPLF
ncbi:cardiolipin synthase [Acetitomaculum ruminis DSM 5522]|uniref:Cardiolipin synthase n=1 Tax=Acetitomaculum ruminis DSM 5522 TaxID=1120918 RepID=A0A1I0UYR5_9FIRM|nr:cardiolipin synthase [Acetitomaculum ruminis]SFA69234.1 cardiolipin synthase [Acetitomaculum ruminis DSM 5522]